MAGALKMITGDNTATDMARAEAAANQRRALAGMARDGAAADAGGQKLSGKKGRGLLSFLGAGGSGGLAAA